MPSTRIAQEYTVRCPECGNAFVSSTLHLFGFINYAKFQWFLAAICFLRIIAVVLLTLTRYL